jgi:hypothetical protein
LTRAVDILLKENVQFELETVMAYVDLTYPDLRKCIGLLQQNTVNNVLNLPREDDESVKDYIIEAVNLFKTGKYYDGRKLIIAQADTEDYDSVYRFFYQNLDLFGKTEDQQDDALLVIRKALIHDPVVADREINLSACLVELTHIAKQK